MIQVWGYKMVGNIRSYFLYDADLNEAKEIIRSARATGGEAWLS